MFRSRTEDTIYNFVQVYVISFINTLTFFDVLILLEVTSCLNLSILGFVYLCGLRSFFTEVRKGVVN